MYTSSKTLKSFVFFLGLMLALSVNVSAQGETGDVEMNNEAYSSTEWTKGNKGKGGSAKYSESSKDGWNSEESWNKSASKDVSYKEMSDGEMDAEAGSYMPTAFDYDGFQKGKSSERKWEKEEKPEWEKPQKEEKPEWEKPEKTDKPEWDKPEKEEKPEWEKPAKMEKPEKEKMEKMDKGEWGKEGWDKEAWKKDDGDNWDKDSGWKKDVDGMQKGDKDWGGKDTYQSPKSYSHQGRPNGFDAKSSIGSYTPSDMTKTSFPTNHSAGFNHSAMKHSQGHNYATPPSFGGGYRGPSNISSYNGASMNP